VGLLLLETADLIDPRVLLDSGPLGVEAVVPDHELYGEAHVGVTDAPAFSHADQQVLLADVAHEHVEAHTHADRPAHALLAVHEDLALLLLDDLRDELDALLEDTLDVLPACVLEEEIELDQSLLLEGVVHDVAGAVDHVRDPHLLQQRQVAGHLVAAHLELVLLHGRDLVLEVVLFEHLPVSILQLPVLLAEVLFSLGGVLVLDQLVLVLLAVQVRTCSQHRHPRGTLGCTLVRTLSELLFLRG